MIEQGLKLLVQSDATVQGICAAGGFLVEIPKGQPLPNWCYRFFGGTPVNALGVVGGLTMRRYQVDVIAGEDDRGSVISLAAAIDAVLDGFAGVLSDPGATLVNSCLKTEEPMDHPFDFERRGFRRSLEYEVWFYDR